MTKIIKIIIIIMWAFFHKNKNINNNNKKNVHFVDNKMSFYVHEDSIIRHIFHV